MERIASELVRSYTYDWVARIDPNTLQLVINPDAPAAAVEKVKQRVMLFRKQQLLQIQRTEASNDGECAA